MTLLSALQDVQRLSSLPTTQAIVGNAEESQQLLFAIAREAAQEMKRRKYWPQIEASHAFTTSAALLQATGMPADFDRVIKGTFWNVDDKQRVWPVSAENWRRLNSGLVTPAGEQFFRVRGGSLYLFPAPAAGVNMVFDYITNTPVRTAADAPIENFANDTDVYPWGDETLKRDVRWRYLAKKGLDYAEELKSFEIWLESEYNASEVEGSDNVMLHGFGGDSEMPEPGLADGSWSL